MIDTFVFRGEWIDNIEKMPEEMQDKILADMVRYGTRREMKYKDDPIISSLVNMVKGGIDHTIGEYEKKLEMSKTAGRKKTFDDNIIYDMAREGKTAQEIAKELGCSKSTVDKSDGWRFRKDDNWLGNQ